MFDLGWTEMLVIGIVALIVIGPKDLPVMFRTVGQFVGKAKGMEREFSRAMNDAANESGVKDVTKGLQAAVNPVNTAMDGVKKAASDLGKFDPESETGKLAAEKKAERAENAKKIQAATARSQAERKLKEAQAAQAKAEELEAQVTPPEKSDT